MACLASMRCISRPALGAMATIAATAASRTGASRSSSALTTTGTDSLALSATSRRSISSLMSRNADSRTRRVSSRALQFLCRHAGDSAPRMASGGAAPWCTSASIRRRPASLTTGFWSPRRSNAPGRKLGTCGRNASGSDATARAAARSAPEHTFALLSFSALPTASDKRAASARSETRDRSRNA